MSARRPTWRGLIAKLGPRWLTRDFVAMPDGTTLETDSRILFPIFTLFDWATDRLRIANYASMPDYAPDDAIPEIVKDRGLRRGRDETREGINARLKRAIDDKRIAGSYWSVLEQLRGYMSPHEVKVRIWNEHGNCYTIGRDGVRSLVRDAGDWNWDGAPDPEKVFARFWVLIYVTTGSPTEPWQRSDTWGTPGGVWGTPGRTWGSTATSNEVKDIRGIVDDWKARGSRCSHILVVFDDAAFEPGGVDLPDGTWKYSSKQSGGIKVPARDARAIYWKGTP